MSGAKRGAGAGYPANCMLHFRDCCLNLPVQMLGMHTNMRETSPARVGRDRRCLCAGSFRLWFLLAFWGLSLAPARAESPVLMAHMFASGSAPDTVARAFAERAADATGRRVGIEVAGNAVLGNERQNILQLVQGSIGFALTGDLFVTSVLPESQAASLPFIAADFDAAARVRTGPLADALSRAAAGYGLEVLSGHCVGQRFLTANRPVPDRSAIAGLKLRLPTDPVWTAAWRALGADVVNVPFPDLPLALAAGRVDAQENPTAMIRSSDIHRHQKYLMLTGHYVQFQYLVASRAAVEQLAPQDRAAVRRAARTVSAEACRAARQAQDADLAWLAGQGMTIVPFDSAGIRDTVVDLLQALEPPPGPDMLQALGLQRHRP